MDATEKIALEKLLKDQLLIYKAIYFALRDIDRSTPDQIKERGHTSTAEAMRSQFQFYVRQMDKLLAAHTRAFPDSPRRSTSVQSIYEPSVIKGE